MANYKADISIESYNSQGTIAFKIKTGKCADSAGEFEFDFIYSDSQGINYRDRKSEVWIRTHGKKAFIIYYDLLLPNDLELLDVTVDKSTIRCKCYDGTANSHEHPPLSAAKIISYREGSLHDEEIESNSIEFDSKTEEWYRSPFFFYDDGAPIVEDFGSLGFGSLSITGERMAEGVERREMANVSEKGTLADISLIESEKDLYNKLRVDIKASFSGFVGEASAKYQFAREISYNSYNSYMMVRVHHELRKLSLINPALTTNAQELLEGKHYKQFLQTYGDMFCKEVTFGGDLFAVAEFSSINREEREYVSAQIKAISGPASLESNFEEKINSISRNSTLVIRIYRSGSSGTLPDHQDLIQYAKAFPNEIKESGGSEIHRLYSSYLRVPRPPNINVPTLQTQIMALQELAEHKADAVSLLEKWLFAKSHPEDFFIPNAHITSHSFGFRKEPNTSLIKEAEHHCEELEKIILNLANIAASIQRDFYESPPTVTPHDLSPHMNSPIFINRPLPLNIILRSAGRIVVGDEGERVRLPSGWTLHSIQAQADRPFPDLKIEYQINYLKVYSGGGFQPPPKVDIQTGCKLTMAEDMVMELKA
ncbi:hypothetical protein GCM10027040_25120 [Halomonas shantousis]